MTLSMKPNEDAMKERRDLPGRPLINKERSMSLFEVFWGQTDERKASDFIEDVIFKTASQECNSPEFYPQRAATIYDNRRPSGLAHSVPDIETKRKKSAAVDPESQHSE